MMKIAIVGLGFVGLSLAAVLSAKGNNVFGIDVDENKCTSIKKGISPFFEPDLEKTLRIGLKKNLKISNNFSMIKNVDIIFVTVGTPQSNSGAIELSIMKNAIKMIGKIIGDSKKNQIIFIKSTVTPGSMKNIILPILEKTSKRKAGKDFGLISNPEFLQESTAIKDTKYPHAVVLGGYQTKFMDKAKKIFTKFHPNTPIIVTNHQTAEMIKYANNSFLATKISFINQLSNICQRIPGANIDDVAKTIGLDPRIGKLFLNAGPGYGGSCLPKDMKALINFAGSVGIKPTLLNAVEKTNEKQLEDIILKITKTLGKLKNKRITILGTSFKPDTDDIRDSIAIELIKKLLRKQASITIYDPKAIENTKKVFNTKIEYAESISKSLQKSECIVIMVHWKEFEILNNNLINKMKKKFIIDCRRVLVKKELHAEYYAIGIGK
jgi:UDPglucose 6-dehydrogenase